MNIILSIFMVLGWLVSLMHPEEEQAVFGYYLPLAYQDYTYGRSQVGGRIVDEYGAPMESGVVMLAEIYCDGFGDCVIALDVAFSPSSWVVEDGAFQIENVYPTRYVIVYGEGDIYAGYQIICNVGTKEPRVWIAPPGEAIDTGALAVWRDGKHDMMLFVGE